MKKELTVQNFTSDLSTALSTRFHPQMKDARLKEVTLSLRSIIGESAWQHDLLDKRDIATLYAVIETRKLKIPASEDPDSHMTQHWLGQLVKDTGIKLGMREHDFEDQRLVNRTVLNLLLSAEPPIPSLKTVDFDAIVNRYAGSDTRGNLIDPDLLPPENPLIIKRKPERKSHEKPDHKPRAEKRQVLAAAEPSHKLFDRRWEALQAYATANEMDADGITSFIARGTKEAINLDQESFMSKCSLARKSLSWNQADSPEAQKLIDGLETAYKKHHEKRALGGIKRD
jgi:hypothetical protein